MTTRHWTNGDQGQYADATQWQDGVPRPGDTAVIATTGGSAPQPGIVSPYFYQVGTGDSVAVLAGVLAPILYPERNIANPNTGTILSVPGLFPTEDQIAPGDDVAGQTIDFLGQGSVTGFALQRTTLQATTTLNVSGVAVANAYYDNTLAGTVNIGLPITVDGEAVPTPAADSRGATSELDLLVSGDGSTDNGTLNLRTYIPATTNAGTINVGDGGAFLLSFEAGPEAGANIGNNAILTNPGRATFVNSGTLNVLPGGTFRSHSIDQLEIETNGNVSDAASHDSAGVFIWDSFQNTGLINVTGAAGKTTRAEIDGFLTGGGTISIDGGTQGDNTKTVGAFDAIVDDMNFVVRDATVAFYDDVLDNTNRVFGGGITLAGDAVLLADPSTLPDGSGYGAPPYTIAGSPVAGETALDQAFGTPIIGFGNGDTIEITSAHDEGGGDTYTYAPVWDQATQTLTVQRSAESILGGAPTVVTVASFTLEGTYTQSDFTVLSAGPLNTDSLTGQPFFGDMVEIGYAGVVCFAEGTRILTDRGEVPVEALRVGDRVVTTDAGPAPARWIGRRGVDIAAHPRPALVAPVRVRRDAIGPGAPARDLWLSPDHSVLVAGRLLPVRRLLNGTTVVQPTPPRAVTYFHVELDRHAVLLADGLPAESYRDTGNRDFFDEAGGSVAPRPTTPDFDVTTDEDARRVWRLVAERARSLGYAAPEPVRVAA